MCDEQEYGEGVLGHGGDEMVVAAGGDVNTLKSVLPEFPARASRASISLVP